MEILGQYLKPGFPGNRRAHSLSNQICLSDSQALNSASGEEAANPPGYQVGEAIQPSPPASEQPTRPTPPMAPLGYPLSSVILQWILPPTFPMKTFLLHLWIKESLMPSGKEVSDLGVWGLWQGKKRLFGVLQTIQGFWDLCSSVPTTGPSVPPQQAGSESCRDVERRSQSPLRLGNTGTPRVDKGQNLPTC